jgi:hypothetical protein
MFFIFGWGRQKIKNHGVTFKNVCSCCHNEDYWQLAKITTWFTLFFIPVIPYENKYFLFCPVCEKGVYIKSDKYNELRILAEANSDLIAGKITEIEYNNRLNNNNSQPISENKVIEGTAITENVENIFCVKCGDKNEKESNYCQSCGAGLIKSE